MLLLNAFFFLHSICSFDNSTCILCAFIWQSINFCFLNTTSPQVARETASPGSDSRLGLDIVEGGRTALDNKTSLLNTPSPRSFAGPRTREFAPYGYADTIGGYDKSALKEAVFDDDVEQFRDCEFALCH